MKISVVDRQVNGEDQQKYGILKLISLRQTLFHMYPGWCTATGARYLTGTVLNSTLLYPGSYQLQR